MPATLIELLSEIHQTVGKIEGRQEEFLRRFDQHVEDDRLMMVKIDRIEKAQNEGAGRRNAAVWTVAAIMGLFSGWLGHKF
jgi:hypothetical protein